MSSSIPAGKRPTPVTTLPSEIISSILTRLPGKPVARCKVICKAWLSTIESSPFRKAYRRRHHGLIMHWSEDLDRATPRRYSDPERRRHFYFSPLWLPNEHPPPEDFHPVLHVDIQNSFDDAVTQVVNGLVCYVEKESRTVYNLTLYSIFTGEKMKVPRPDPVYNKSAESVFHLGYDPITGVYKIVRCVFQFNRGGSVSFLTVCMIDLKPSGEHSEWGWIDYKNTGLPGLGVSNQDVWELVNSHEAMTFADDGMLCWLWQEEVRVNKRQIDNNTLLCNHK